MTQKEKPLLHWVRISPKQILGEFDSKIKKDGYGNPVKLSRILLPSKEFSKNPLGECATIVVPSWTVMDDKYYKETDPKKYRILGINLGKTYEVLFNSNVKDAAGHNTKEKTIVQGDRLVEAFVKPEKQKELESKKMEDKDINEKKTEKKQKRKKELAR